MKVIDWKNSNEEKPVGTRNCLIRFKNILGDRLVTSSSLWHWDVNKQLWFNHWGKPFGEGFVIEWEYDIL